MLMHMNKHEGGTERMINDKNTTLIIRILRRGAEKNVDDFINTNKNNLIITTNVTIIANNDNHSNYVWLSKWDFLYVNLFKAFCSN